MKKAIVEILVCVAFLLIGGNFAFASSEPEPFELITAPEVKALLEDGKVVIVHVLSEIEYGIQHIPGSINIPIIKMKTTNKLPKEKDTPLVFYCMGKRCPYTKRAARIAAEKGYDNVFSFVGGIPEWRFFNYPMTVNKEWQKIKVNKIAPHKFKRLSEEENFYILDVRPKGYKLNTRFIKGAIHCPLVYLVDRYTKIPKNQMIVITDYAMKQSPVAAKFLTIKGYPVVGVLKGGLERWNSEGLPTKQRVPTQKIGSLNGSREK